MIKIGTKVKINKRGGTLVGKIGTIWAYTPDHVVYSATMNGLPYVMEAFYAVRIDDKICEPLWEEMFEII